MNTTSAPYVACCCSSEACRLYGCAALKAMQPQPPQQVGWICPKCNQGVAPSMVRCPCAQQVTGPSPLFPIPSTSGSSTISWSPETGWLGQDGQPMVVTPTS